MTNKDKLNRFAKAVNALRTAAQALEQIQNDGGKYCYDAAYYKIEIMELISTDDGEGGLDALIRLVEKEIAK